LSFIMFIVNHKKNIDKKNPPVKREGGYNLF
jgi:hypothetical protein